MNCIEIEDKTFYPLKVQSLQNHRFANGEATEEIAVLFKFEPNSPLNGIAFKGFESIEVKAGKPYFEYLARAFFNSEEIYVAFGMQANEPARIAAVLPKLRPITG